MSMREDVLYKLFLNLYKVYDVFYRGRCKNILVLFRIGSRTERVLWYYWENLYILELVVHDYYSPFKIHLGVNQGGIPPPPFPPSSKWWWTQCFFSVSRWYQERRWDWMILDGLFNGCQCFLTLTMGSYPHLGRPAYRRCWMFWRGYSTGLVYIPM